MAEFSGQQGRSLLLPFIVYSLIYVPLAFYVVGEASLAVPRQVSIQYWAALAALVGCPGVCFAHLFGRMRAVAARKGENFHVGNALARWVVIDLVVVFVVFWTELTIETSKGPVLALLMPMALPATLAEFYWRFVVKGATSG